MFAFSLKIINNFFKTPLTQTEVCGVLNEKGFEVLEVKETLNDIIIKIDVRNNRSDMLCYVGVARELGQLTKRDILWNSVPQNIRDFSQGEMSTYNLTIENGTCESCVIVVGAPKKIVAQDNFYKVLEVAGVEISTNCYINIINYFAILYGVSISIIDMDSINSKDILISSVQNSDCVFSGCVIPKGSIIISNNERILSVPCFCSTNAKCDTPLEKKCLMILGVYNRTLIRKTSKKMLQQDASAYIMSRGGNDYYYWMVVEKIKEYFTLFELKFIKQSCECEITVSISRLCDIVGNHFEADLICNVFDKCGFNARMIDDDFIRLTIPSVRQDVTSEIEAIEEFIRVYGYNKIIPSIPLIPAIVKKMNVMKN